MTIGLGHVNGSGFIPRPNRTQCRPRHMYGHATMAARLSADMVPVAMAGDASMSVSMVGVATDADGAAMTGDADMACVLTGVGNLAYIKWSVTGEGDMSDPGLIDGT